MRFFKAAIVLFLIIFVCTSVFAVTDAEKQLIDKFMKKHKKNDNFKKLGWISGSYTLDRINRNNNYNSFATYESNNFNNTNISWLNTASTFALEAGMIFGDKFAWSVGGEYWMKFGENQSGTFDYNSSGLTTSVTDLKSEIKVWGLTTGVSYYITNPPSVSEHISEMALRVTSLVGYYQVSWDLWEGYENLNLVTSTPASSNTIHKGSAPGISLGMGMDYPLNIMGLTAGVDFSYFYLNFNNVAWYNGLDQEIVATYSTDADSRVDLNFSGFRGKIEFKRYFSW